MDKRRLEYQIFLSKIFFLSVERISRVTLLCYVSENFWQQKFLWIRRGGNQHFPSKLFCLTVPKNSIAEPFIVSLIWSIEEIYASEGYVMFFCREFFVSQYRNISQRNPSVLCFRKFPVAKKFMHNKEGKYQYSPLIFFRLTLSKSAVGVSFSLSKISTMEKFWKRW